MKNLLFCTISIISLLTGNLNAQKTIDKDNFTFQVQKEKGDLNKDNILDEVYLKMDTIDKTEPLRLQIYLSQPNIKKLKLVVSSTKIIESQYPKSKNGKHNGNTIPDFFIEDGNLQMLTDISDGLKSRYTFKFQNGNFELIHISRVLWDGKETTTETEIDLIKGTKEVYDQDFGPTKKYKLKQKTTPKPLPKIQDLTFSDLAKY